MTLRPIPIMNEEETKEFYQDLLYETDIKTLDQQKETIRILEYLLNIPKE